MTYEYDEYDEIPTKKSSIFNIIVNIAIIGFFIYYVTNKLSPPETETETPSFQTRTTTTPIPTWRSCKMCTDTETDCSVGRCPSIFSDGNLDDKLFVKIGSNFIPIERTFLHKSCNLHNCGGSTGGSYATTIYVLDQGEYKKIHNTSMCKNSIIGREPGSVEPISICEQSVLSNRDDRKGHIPIIYIIVLNIILAIITFFILKK